jgi:hypothetical protein
MWKCWKKLKTSQGKMKYLQHFLKKSTLHKLWMEEVPVEMFCDLVQVLEEHLSRHDNTTPEMLGNMARILDAASKSRRYEFWNNS